MSRASRNLTRRTSFYSGGQSRNCERARTSILVQKLQRNCQFEQDQPISKQSASSDSKFLFSKIFNSAPQHSKVKTAKSDSKEAETVLTRRSMRRVLNFDSIDNDKDRRHSVAGVMSSPVTRRVTRQSVGDGDDKSTPVKRVTKVLSMVTPTKNVSFINASSSYSTNQPHRTSAVTPKRDADAQRLVALKSPSLTLTPSKRVQFSLQYTPSKAQVARPTTPKSILKTLSSHTPHQLASGTPAKMFLGSQRQDSTPRARFLQSPDLFSSHKKNLSFFSPNKTPSKLINEFNSPLKRNRSPKSIASKKSNGWDVTNKDERRVSPRKTKYSSLTPAKCISSFNLSAVESKRDNSPKSSNAKKSPVLHTTPPTVEQMERRTSRSLTFQENSTSSALTKNKKLLHTCESNTTSEEGKTKIYSDLSNTIDQSSHENVLVSSDSAICVDRICGIDGKDFEYSSEKQSGLNQDTISGTDYPTRTLQSSEKRLHSVHLRTPTKEGCHLSSNTDSVESRPNVSEFIETIDRLVEESIPEHSSITQEDVNFIDILMQENSLPTTSVANKVNSQETHSEINASFAYSNSVSNETEPDCSDGMIIISNGLDKDYRPTPLLDIPAMLTDAAHTIKLHSVWLDVNTESDEDIGRERRASSCSPELEIPAHVRTSVEKSMEKRRRKSSDTSIKNNKLPELSTNFLTADILEDQQEQRQTVLEDVDVMECDNVKENNVICEDASLHKAVSRAVNSCVGAVQCCPDPTVSDAKTTTTKDEDVECMNEDHVPDCQNDYARSSISSMKSDANIQRDEESNRADTQSIHSTNLDTVNTDDFQVCDSDLLFTANKRDDSKLEKSNRFVIYSRETSSVQCDSQLKSDINSSRIILTDTDTNVSIRSSYSSSDNCSNKAIVGLDKQMTRHPSMVNKREPGSTTIASKRRSSEVATITDDGNAVKGTEKVLIESVKSPIRTMLRRRSCTRQIPVTTKREDTKRSVRSRPVNYCEDESTNSSSNINVSDIEIENSYIINTAESHVSKHISTVESDKENINRTLRSRRKSNRSNFSEDSDNDEENSPVAISTGSTSKTAKRNEKMVKSDSFDEISSPVERNMFSREHNLCDPEAGVTPLKNVENITNPERRCSRPKAATSYVEFPTDVSDFDCESSINNTQDSITFNAQMNSSIQETLQTKLQEQQKIVKYLSPVHKATEDIPDLSSDDFVNIKSNMEGEIDWKLVKPISTRQNLMKSKDGDINVSNPVEIPKHKKKKKKRVKMKLKKTGDQYEVSQYNVSDSSFNTTASDLNNISHSSNKLEEKNINHNKEKKKHQEERLLTPLRFTRHMSKDLSITPEVFSKLVADSPNGKKKSKIDLKRRKRKLSTFEEVPSTSTCTPSRHKKTFPRLASALSDDDEDDLWRVESVKGSPTMKTFFRMQRDSQDELANQVVKLVPSSLGSPSVSSMLHLATSPMVKKDKFDDNDDNSCILVDSESSDVCEIGNRRQSKRLIKDLPAESKTSRIRKRSDSSEEHLPVSKRQRKQSGDSISKPKSSKRLYR